MNANEKGSEIKGKKRTKNMGRVKVWAKGTRTRNAKQKKNIPAKINK